VTSCDRTGTDLVQIKSIVKAYPAEDPHARRQEDVTSCDRVGGLNETRVEYLRGSRPAEDPHARGQEDVASCVRTGLKLSKRQKARSSPTPGGWKEVRRQELAIVKGRGPAPRQGAGSTSSTSLYPKVLLLRSFENCVSSALTRDIEPPPLTLDNKSSPFV
jgi:hypothetical protein